MLALAFEARGMMNLHLENGVSEGAQHGNGDAKGVLDNSCRTPSAYGTCVQVLWLSRNKTLSVLTDPKLIDSPTIRRTSPET